MDRRNRKLRRRFRVIAARAMLCALVFSALGFTGYRNAMTPDEASSQTATIAPDSFGP